MRIILLVAVASNGWGMGFKNSLPWHIPRDLKFFKESTVNKVILMGRKTFESIGKPLPNRTNVIITTQENYLHDSNYENVLVENSLFDVIEYYRRNHLEELIIIGGAEIFRQTLPIATDIYLTDIYGDFEVDTFFPTFDKSEWHPIESTTYPPDEKNKYTIRIRKLVRLNEYTAPEQLKIPFDAAE